jgi:drug/metabolite transporter (DMT)-like permease
MAGLGILFNPFGFDWSNPAVVRGNLILVGASAVWAVVILHLRVHRYGGDPLDLAPWQLLVASAVIAPVALVLDAGKPVLWSLDLVGMLTYAGPISTFLTVWGVVAIGRTLPAITTSLAFLSTPVAAMICGALLLNEPLTWTNVLGLAAILFGLGLVAVSERRSLPAAQPGGISR